MGEIGFIRNSAVQIKKELSHLPQELPAVDNEERSNFDRLFVDSGISVASGFLGKVEADKVCEKFVVETLSTYIVHMQRFAVAMKKFFSMAPSEYQNMVGHAENNQLRVFEAVNAWDIATINDELNQLMFSVKDMYIEKMIPLIYMMGRPVMQLLFLGELQFNNLLDKTYEEIKEMSTVGLPDLIHVVSDAKKEWSFIARNVVRGLYPLVMRICSSYCVSFQEFLNDNVSMILKFFLLKREDIILPCAFKKVKISNFEDSNISSVYAQVAQAEEKRRNSGLNLLDKLFPEAGWKNLSSMPDMYPYFQKIYSFKEGFNIISPENPMQAAVVLLRIVEDLFTGCSSIGFKDVNLSVAPVAMTSAEISKAISDWYLIRMNVFDKDYSELLKDYVDRIYSQKEFRASSVGMKKLSGIYKLQKSEFFPHSKFSANLVEAAEAEFGSQPVFKKISKLARYFDWIADNVEKALKLNGGMPGSPVTGIKNPWDKYVFPIENVVSERLTILLGGRGSVNITNGRLLLAIAEIFSVLDWWMNDTRSFAYTNELEMPYRHTSGGEPVFSVPLRNDAELLFMRVNKKR